MDEKEKEYVEICVGIGLDQFTPEYIKIPVESEPIKESKKTKKSNEIEIEREK
jgi:hypothetical protein